MSTNITMTFEDFCNAVIRYFEEKYPEAEVITKEVTKNNGLVLTGLCVRKGEDVLPIIYLEQYWKMFRKCEDLHTVFEGIDKALSQGFEFPDDFKKEDFNDFEKMKSWLCLRVVNKEKNKEFLKTVPYITILDLAVVFYIYLGKGASVQVTDEFLERWKIDKSEFIKEYIPIAMANTNRLLPGAIFNMVNFIGAITGVKAKEDELCEDIMFVMTNQAKYYGAACLATEGHKLKKFAEEHKSGFYILPSSVHEVILILGDNNRKDTKSLYRMVREVNRTMVDQDEILSDNVYYFDRELGYPVLAETVEDAKNATPLMERR